MKPRVYRLGTSNAGAQDVVTKLFPGSNSTQTQLLAHWEMNTEWVKTGSRPVKWRFGFADALGNLRMTKRCQDR